ncbi:tRNA (adenosine(37)-N6)-dimethylallyltransferase MiaA [Buchnera aphidicola (Mindarus keteleerifoliae)]|uniref:tRNA (adenosine(37)-N6)-dimethylallyltransferase MiaA n=1 Tax=Buchnera aphidicola TaxID=9 RepID=UPI0031B6AF16
MKKNINFFQKPKLIFIMGPTCSGKTKLAINLSKHFPMEIISVDSGLIYRKMNIGTAKPNIKELSRVPHHLINIKDPSEYYSAGDFRKDALKKIKIILSLGKVPVLVGGTMLYFKVLNDGIAVLPPANNEIRNYLLKQSGHFGCKYLYNILRLIDPNLSVRIHPNDIQRVIRGIEVFLITGKKISELQHFTIKNFPYEITQFSIFFSKKEELHKRIKTRLNNMIKLGFEEEVRKLLFKKELKESFPAIRRIGYYQMWNYIEGKITYQQMIEQILLNTFRLAKHQTTWLKKWKNLHWIENSNHDLSIKKILSILDTKNY